MIRSISEYEKCLNMHYAGAGGAGIHLLYRGHERPEYQNLPTLCRLNLSLENTLKYESLIHRFFMDAVDASPGFLGSIKLRPDQPDKKYLNTWFQLTQQRHLELPSRLQDWTMMRLVALYFAVSNPDHHQYDGHIWVLPSPTSRTSSSHPILAGIRASYHHLGAGDEDMRLLDMICPFDPERALLVHYAHLGIDWSAQTAELRRAVQGGKFIACTNALLQTPLDEQNPIRQLMRRFEIPASAKPSILAEFSKRDWTPDKVLPRLPDDAIQIIEDIKARAREALGL